MPHSASNPAPAPPPLYTVGIGASAGGLEALERFFEPLPDDPGMIFVIIQHLSPDYKSMMAEILSKYTAMPVREAEEGVRMERDHVYLIPPSKSITMSGGQLFLREKQPNHRGIPLPIDTFFESLALERGDHAIGVILSGTGSDGTRGVRAIKGSGGMVMVQRPTSAKFDGMPVSALDTGLADYVLPPEEMALALLDFRRHPGIALARQEDERRGDNEPGGEVKRILELVRQRSDVDFLHYKPNTILRRIERRASIRQCRDIREYLELMRHSDQERDTLYRDLLIGVTRFFRDAEAFEALRQRILHPLFAARGETIRVWIPACSTGEEAYSLAILFAEHQALVGDQREIKIFATDIDQNAVEIGAAGVYPEGIATDVAPERLSRFFKRDEQRGRYTVSPHLRRMVAFARHDLTKSPPFNRLDLISCRNLFIYLRPEMQDRILHLFHFALKQPGYLFMGESESIGDYEAVFTCLDRRHKLYQTRPGVTPRLPQLHDVPMPMPSDPGQTGLIPVSAGGRTSRQQGDILQRLVADRMLPPCILINDNLDALYISRRAARYLAVSGTPDYNLAALLPESIAAFVRSAVMKALKQGQTVVYKALASDAGDYPALAITVEPLSKRHGGAPLLMVTLEEPASSQPATAQSRVEISADSRQHIEELEQELSYTRETLQATIEELETSNEELQSSNEELLASNEELQSTNEELQAVNEELITVNSEHQHKIRELAELNETHDNLLRSSQVGTVFLDRHFNVRSFTPAVRDEIHLRDSDIGRPFDEIRHHLRVQDLSGELNETIRTLSLRELEVSSDLGNYYILRIAPFLLSDDSVDGVVLTLVNISERKRIEIEVRKLSRAVEQTPSAVIITDRAARIEYVNPAFERTTGYTAAEALGQNPRMLKSDEHDQAFYRQLWGKLIEEGAWHGEIVNRRKDGELYWELASISAVRDEQGKTTHYLSIQEDITARKASEAALDRARRAAEQANRAKSDFLANMSHELRTPLNAILGYSQVLERDPEIGDRQRKDLANIRGAGEFLRLLIDDILDLARIEAGRFELHAEPCGLAPLVNRIEEMIRPKIGDKPVSFDVLGVRDLPETVRADERRLQQILLNLLSNAVKFTARGFIRLDLGYHQGRLRAQVADSGIGMNAEQLARLFEPFSQFAVNAQKEGSGLGLMISKSLAEAMGGMIEVESTPDEGSRFTVTLPLPPLAARDAPSRDRYPSLEGYARNDAMDAPLRLLVVDDGAENRAVLRRLLEPLGFEVDEAENGRAALERVGATSPDLVLMDLAMPEMDGLTATRELLRQTPALPIVAVSARAFRSDREESAAAGCVEHIAKPVSAEALLKVLEGRLPLTWKATEDGPSGETGREQPLDLSPLNRETRAELEGLVLQGNGKAIHASIEALRGEHEQLARNLTLLTNAYRYQEILDALEVAR